MNIPKDLGQFKELPSGKCLFSKDNPFPVKTWQCPVCSQLNRKGDDVMMLKYGMCERCSCWWDDELLISPNSTFDQKLNKFKKWVESKSNEL